MAKKFQLLAHKVERNSHSGFVGVEPFGSDRFGFVVVHTGLHAAGVARFRSQSNQLATSSLMYERPSPRVIVCFGVPTIRACLASEPLTAGKFADPVNAESVFLSAQPSSGILSGMIECRMIS
jgi:hypothetical protein